MMEFLMSGLRKHRDFLSTEMTKMAINGNPMDNLSDKQKEEAMGLSQSQRLELEAAGLTKKEIDDIHAKRVAEGIAKERERLDKLENKIKKKIELPLFLSRLLVGNEEAPQPDDEGKYDEETIKLFLSEYDESNLPWAGRKDLIMSNNEYWREVHKVCPPSKEEMEEKPLDDMTEEELKEAADRYFGRINSKGDRKSVV